MRQGGKPHVLRFTNLCLMLSLFQPIFLLIALAFIFAGSALAADDHWPSTTDRYTGAFQAASNSGEDLYQFWCSTCHGDRGQGLTPEWRATWPKEKQNCWQAKCHASSHPPDGFTIPKNVPALIGPETLGKFNTAQDLYGYISAAMPYWSPNRLKEDEYRAITAFLVKANYQANGLAVPATLPVNWATFLLHPALNETAESVYTAVIAAPQSAPSSLLPDSYYLPLTPRLLLWLLPLIPGGIIIFILTRRFF